jgi:hypothetical protein
VKKNIFSILLFLSSISFAQIDITAGMGLNFFSAPDLKDYINSYSTAVDEMQSFNTSADFFGEIGYDINQNYQIALEYTFNIYSFNSTGINGIYDFEVDQHKPSLIGYYVLPGMGYKLKFGFGVGLRNANIKEKFSGLTKTADYSTSGFGVIAKAQGDTRLSGDFYAVIVGELRYDMPGEIEAFNKAKFNVNTLGVILKLGISYHL